MTLARSLRQGEILGLKWSDVDLGAKTLRVNRLRRDGDSFGQLTFVEPKNASRRTVPLRATAVEILKRTAGGKRRKR